MEEIVIEVEQALPCYACNKEQSFFTLKSDNEDGYRYQYSSCDHCGYLVSEDEHTPWNFTCANWNIFQKKMKRWLDNMTSSGTR